MNSSAIFEADPEGFRAQNADRPPEHLVRELVQNAMDEDGVMNLDITVTYHGPRKGTTVQVKDDSPTGVKDAKLLFTIWLSNKQDSPTKRGRMGRGLKELVSVADFTTIRSCSCDALTFERFNGGRWERKIALKLGRPERGTEVTAFCRAWGEKASKTIADFLRRVRAPGSITMRVAYSNKATGVNSDLEQVRPFPATEVYESMFLPTVLFEVKDGERAERERTRATRVECFTPPPGEKAKVYEMGIPVEECDSPVSIDVGQRVILRERRDTLTESYKRQLFAEVLSARIGRNLVPDEQLRDNAILIAAQNSWALSTKAKQKIAHVWTEGKPFAADSKSRAIATGHHIENVNLRSLPEAIREIVRAVGTDVRTVMDQRKAEFCPALDVLSPEQSRLKGFFEWIAAGIKRPCSIELRGGNPGAMADFNRAERVLAIYVDVVKAPWFKDPTGADQLATLIHELSHWEPKEDEHGSDFAHDNDAVGGEVASFLFNNVEQAKLFLKRET